MNLKTKAFIYRFSNIFGLRIYLAKKEENEFIEYLNGLQYSDFLKNVHIGLWHAKNGFTTIGNHSLGFFEELRLKIKHAFDFTYMEY